MYYSVQGREATHAIRVSLQQADRALTGTWTVTSPGANIRGEVRGTLSDVGDQTAFSGSISWSGDTASGTGSCLANAAAVSGASAPPILNWVSSGWTFTTPCAEPPREVTWRLGRE